MLLLISQNLKRSRDSALHTHPFWGNIMHALVLLCSNQHTKCSVPSFTFSAYMIGGKIK